MIDATESSIFRFRLTSSEQNNQSYVRKTQQNNGPSTNGLSRGNVVAVEPYNHVPLPTGHQIKTIQQNTQEVCTFLWVFAFGHAASRPDSFPVTYRALSVLVVCEFVARLFWRENNALLTCLDSIARSKRECFVYI